MLTIWALLERQAGSTAEEGQFSVIEAEEEKDTIINRAIEMLRNDLYKDGKWYADYVRIRMKAIRL